MDKQLAEILSMDVGYLMQTALLYFWVVVVPFVENIDLQLRQTKWIPITLLTLLIVLAIVDLRIKWGRKRRMSPPRNREEYVERKLADGVSDAIEKLADQGVITDAEANTWYSRFGNILNMRDLLNQKIVVIPADSHGDVLDPMLPVTEGVAGTIVKAKTLKERIGARLGSGIHLKKANLPEEPTPRTKPALSDFGKKRSAA